MKGLLIFFCVIFSPLIIANEANINVSSSTTKEMVEQESIEQTEFEDSDINVGGYKIKLKGFFSAAGGVTTAKEYTSPLSGGLVNPLYYGLGRSVTFESDSLAGLQLNAPVTDDSEVVLQIVARGRATDQITDKYELNANWAYLNYHFNDNVSIKIGRVLMPVYLLSQYADVAYAYPWIKPPQEIYGSVPVPSSNGFMVNWNVSLSDEWQLALIPFFLSNVTKTPYPTATGLTDLKLTNFVGLSANISNDWLKISAVYTQGKLSLNDGNTITVVSPPLPNMTLPGVNINTAYMSAGMRLEKDNLLILAEIALRRSPGSYLRDVRSWYALAGYQINKVMPYVTYAQINSINKERLNALSGVTRTVMSSVLFQEQRSIEAGLRYDVANNMALKMSVTHIEPLNGTRGLFSATPNQKTINVYNAGINFVF